MKIVKLTSENVKRLNAVEITPKGDLVIVGGNNAQGKTSVLDSIAMALGGGDTACAMALHKGAAIGKTVVELDDLIITRTYTAAGGTALAVTSKEGASYKSPQTMLDGLVGKLTFDPLDFLRMKPDKQLDALREMAGINFELLNSKRDRVYTERTDLNRDLKRVQGLLASLEHYDDAPTEEVSVVELSVILEEIREHNRANQEWRDDLKTYDDRITTGKTMIADLEKKLHDAKVLLVTLETQREETLAHIEKCKDEDPAPILEKIANAEENNRKVRANVAYLDAKDAVSVKETKSAELTRQLEEIEKKKLEKIQAAKFPIDGLSLNDNGVIFNGVPFEQASGAEQLRVSVAIGMAANPKLRVLLCRDGSLLDDNSLRLLTEIVHERDYQLWLERVGEGKECTVIIEDGYVKEIE